jgi:hypothetical protein
VRKLRKFSLITIVALLGLFLVVGNAMAYPFIEVEGFVNPYGGTWTDNGDGTTTITDVTYSFIVTTADGGAEMDYLSLEFEGDVFTSLGNVTFDNPTDWLVSDLTSSTGNMYKITSAGTTLGAAESLIFTIDTLTLYTAALTNVSGDFDNDGSLNDWTEGQIWAQSFNAGDTLGGGDGGSTSPVPEPATLLLFGAGLIGIAGIGRLKMKKRS